MGLYPATIVDKNGKRTTVHRRSSGNINMGKNPPPPRIAAQSDAQGTKLPILTPATAADRDSIIEAFANGTQRFKLKAESITESFSGQDLAVVKRLLDNPSVDNEFVKNTVSHCHYMDTIRSGEMSNALIIGEQIFKNGNKDLLYRRNWMESLTDIVVGLDQDSSKDPNIAPLKEITTEEELAGKVAVVTFALRRASNMRDEEALVVSRVKRVNAKWMRDYKIISNPHLRTLLMERPEELDAISSYCRERGMHPRNKRPVDALRDYLNDTVNTRTLANGWI